MTTAGVPIALGFRAQRGGSVVVGLAADGPRVVLSAMLATAAEGDRLAFEPYHVAYEMAAKSGGRISPEVAEAVAEGRRRQDDAAAKGLEALIARLCGQGFEPTTAALLVNRAGWMTDLLAHALSAPEHPAVIEGLAVREALRSAFREHGLPAVELDEKTLPEAADTLLGRSTAEALTALGAAAGRPWRKEQKLACLAAWVAIAGR